MADLDEGVHALDDDGGALLEALAAGAEPVDRALPVAEPLLEALDAVVVSSTGSEAVSRIALEAMALARPVVASAVGSPMTRLYFLRM